MLTTDGREFEFPEPGPEMYTLTCVNHPAGRWLTKNPHERSIHWCGWQTTEAIAEFGWRECPCPFSDLRVVL